MKAYTILFTVTILGCCLFGARATRAQSASGFTSIDYDADSNTVDAYSETDLDWNLQGDYDARVRIWVYKNGGFITYQETVDHSGDGIATVEVILSGEPDSTYRANGAHAALCAFSDYSNYYPYHLFYYDNWWLGRFEQQNINVPWYYYFLSNGFQQVARQLKPVNLGTTYDTDTVTTPKLQVEMSEDKHIKDGETASFSVTITGATPANSPTNYEWTFEAPSGAVNTPHVAFSPPNGSSSVTTDGHWFAYPDSACGTSFDATYTIKCKVSFSHSKPKTAQTTLSINAFWDPAGSVNPNEARVIGAPSMAPDANGIWHITGMGNLARQIPQKHVFITTGQFITKADAHEQVHVDQWAPGHLFGSLHQPADYYARIQNFTGTSQADLVNKLTVDLSTYTNAQDDFYAHHKADAETEAYNVSDQIVPKFLYQYCGTNQL